LQTKFRLLFLTLVVCAAAPLALGQEEIEADLAVSKSGPALAAADTDVTYSVSVTNLGPFDAAAVQLSDAIPPGMTFVSETHDPAFTCATGSSPIICTAPLLAVNATANFTFTFHIDPSAAPGTSFTNIAAVSTQTADPNPENNSASSVTFTPSLPTGDMTITKDGPGNAGPDTDVVYTISITNGGPDAAADVTLTDTLPGTMTFVSLVQNSGPTMSCTTGQTVTCTLASFPALNTATFTLTGHVPADTNSGTTFTNTATVAAKNDPNGDNNSATTILTVSAVDISVFKTGPFVANAATDISYTITVSNGPGMAATNVTLNDALPPETTFVALTQNNGPPASCGTPAVGTNGTVTCTWLTLAPDTSAQFTLTINTASAPTASNTATVGSDNFDTNPSNNSASTATAIIQSADVAVTKSGPTNVTGGSDITYMLAATNNGPSHAVSVSLTDTLPPNTTFASFGQTGGPTFSCSTPAPNGIGTVTCTIAMLNAGATATFNLVLHVSPVASGSVTNTANIATTTGDPNPNNNMSTTTALVTPGATDAGIVKTAGPGPYFAGGTASFTLLVTNNGPGLALGTTVTDVLPAGTTLVSATPSQGSCIGASTVSCSLGTLQPAGTATITLVLTLGATAGPVSNTATLTISNGDTVPNNNSSTATITVLPSAAIPTLSEWALGMLAVALAGIALLARR
jgi:uncharacterized repeat protein (TIGR01451 family)